MWLKLIQLLHLGKSNDTVKQASLEKNVSIICNSVDFTNDERRKISMYVIRTANINIRFSFARSGKFLLTSIFYGCSFDISRCIHYTKSTHGCHLYLLCLISYACPFAVIVQASLIQVLCFIPWTIKVSIIYWLFVVLLAVICCYNHCMLYCIWFSLRGLILIIPVKNIGETRD